MQTRAFDFDAVVRVLAAHDRSVSHSEIFFA
jgi:hypothetical protein